MVGIESSAIVRRMSKSRRRSNRLLPDDTVFAGKPRKRVPHEFVLDAIAPLSPRTRNMFGCLAIYVKDKIVLITRDKPVPSPDNGAPACRSASASFRNVARFRGLLSRL